jgi:hypothetical protein
MDKQLLIALLSVFSIAASSCVKNYNFDTSGSKPKYVIEGRISNLPGPYYVRVTRSSTSINAVDSDKTAFTDLADPVTNALVMISDDLGQTDTLKPANERDTWYWYRYDNGRIDSMLGERDPTYTGEEGYYATTKMTGQSGHTYHLTVRIDSGTYESSATVPYPVQLDSAIVLTPNLGDTNYHPAQIGYASWAEPQDQTNYYYLQAVLLRNYPYDAAPSESAVHAFYPYYVFDDRSLPAYVSRMEVDQYTDDAFGHARIAPYLIIYESVQIRLCSIDAVTYEYMNALGQQFMNDGSAYQPTPASAKGNISGGALGLFFGVGVSGKLYLQ